MSKLTEAALEYLGDGQHILALTGKRPNNRFHAEWDWENSIHGLPETPEDEKALAAIFEHSTTTGVAILIPEHMLVADIDTEEAARYYMDLAGETPHTVTAKTPNGLHVWFWVPGAHASVWLGGRTLLFKGFGGYVAAPPSRHYGRDGEFDGVYTWIHSWHNSVVDWLPDGVSARLKTQRAVDALQPVKTAEGGEYVRVEFTPDGGFLLHKCWHLEGLCRAITEAPDGNQNNMIAWAAMQARDEGVPYETAMPLLLEAAVTGGHPKDRAMTTIRGAFKRGRRG